MYFTYILHSRTFDRFYIGQTSDLDQRLKYHNFGKVKSSFPYRPWDLVWYCRFNNRKEAMKRERKLKNLKSQSRVISYMLQYGSLVDNSSSEFLIKIRESSKNF